MADQQPTDALIGKTIQGRYEIRRVIAEGAMGIVYEGVRVQLGRPVAVKFLHRACASNVDSQLRFEREAIAMSKLSHPNCVGVIDFGVDEAPYIVMDLVQGSTVRELIDYGALSPSRSLSIMGQLLLGLGHAHDNQLVHRDVKPANVKVDTDDAGNDYARVLDFGLAKLTDASVTQLTEDGIVAGTTTYMSPEHACGSGIDARSDLYSAGLVLFEMLTGRPPFQAETAAGMLLQHRDGIAPRLSEAQPELRYSEELEQVLHKALAKDKNARFQNAAEFMAALTDLPEAREEKTALAPRRDVKSQSGMRRISLLPRRIAQDLLKRYRNEPRARLWAMASAGVLAIVALLASSLGDGSANAASRKTLTTGHPVAIASAPAAKKAPEPPPPEWIDPAGSARAERLLMRGEHEAALSRIELLLKAEPNNAELHYLAGTAYFEVRRWIDAMASYAAAIKNDPTYSSRPLLNRNVIRALRNQRTHDEARELIVRDLHTAAIPHLRDYHDRARDDQERDEIRALILELDPTAVVAPKVAATTTR